MGRKWTFEDAVNCWRRLKDLETASIADCNRFDDAERFILAHTPQSPDQADALIEVVMAQYGERSDGLDQTALANLRTFVRTPMKQAA